jgi:hypothetical protein
MKIKLIGQYSYTLHTSRQIEIRITPSNKGVDSRLDEAMHTGWHAGWVYAAMRSDSDTMPLNGSVAFGPTPARGFSIIIWHSSSLETGTGLQKSQRRGLRLRQCERAKHYVRLLRQRDRQATDSLSRLHGGR